MTIAYDAVLLKQMALFERITHAKLKDCYTDAISNILTFVVQPGELSKAIGKKGEMVHRLEKLFKRRVHIVQWLPERAAFVQSLIFPLTVETEEQDDIILLRSAERKTRAMLIGRNGQNLRNLEKNVRRHFTVKEIKVEVV